MAPSHFTHGSVCDCSCVERSHAECSNVLPEVLNRVDAPVEPWWPDFLTGNLDVARLHKNGSRLRLSKSRTHKLGTALSSSQLTGQMGVDSCIARRFRRVQHGPDYAGIAQVDLASEPFRFPDITGTCIFRTSHRPSDVICLRPCT